MTDVQRLKNVISTLETQSEDLERFNTLLNVLGESKDRIQKSEASLISGAESCDELVKKSSRLHNIISQSSEKIDRSLSKTEVSVRDLRVEVEDLDFLTPKQFQDGSAELLVIISSELSVLSSKIEILEAAHESSARFSTMILKAGVGSFVILMLILAFR